MKFRTELTPQPLPGVLSHSGGVLLLGSCFSDNMGARLRADLFDVTVNPFGPLYNPLSIVEALRVLADGRRFGEADLFSHSGLWHSWLHHSTFSASTPAEALGRMNSALVQAREALGRISTVFLTLGSTRVFRLGGPDGAVVANCHRVPASRFAEQLLTAQEAADALVEAVRLIRAMCPEGVTIVFTVSPIRHLSSGLEGNSLSKATLRVAIEQACAETGAHYFPAYEIMLDDLRDYRFYGPDMLHPTEVAVDYIYEKLSEAMMTPETQALARECRKLSRRLSHRIMGDGPESERFVAETRRMAEALAAAHPSLAATIGRMEAHQAAAAVEGDIEDGTGATKL